VVEFAQPPVGALKARLVFPPDHVPVPRLTDGLVVTRTESGFIGLLKVMLREAVVATLVVAFAGVVDDTAGGVVSGADPVVNENETLVMELPATSRPLTVMVYGVLYARGLEGVTVTSVLLAVHVGVANVKPGFEVIITDEVSIASSKVTVTGVLTVTLVAEFAGIVETTVGAVVSCCPAPVVNEKT
jgi:hypothetical protein